MENNLIRLSIVIPAYNVAPYIMRCIDSIYSFPIQENELEIIVIDDNSTDNTLQLLYAIQKGHTNLVVLHQKQNKRQGAARNRGIEIAKGEYITFCDADDYMLSEGVVNALNAVAQSHVDVCYFEMEYQDGKDADWHLVEMPKETHNTIMSSKTYLENYYTCYYNGPVRCLYRTEFLKGTNIRFVEGVRWEDCDWTVKVYAKAKEIQFVDGVGYRYVWNESATSRQTDAQAMVEQLMAGVRLTEFAQSVQSTLLCLSKTIGEEAKYRYIVGNIRLRNLTKYTVSDMHYVYQKMSAADWKVIDSHDLPKWETIVVKHHVLTMLILCLACPIAAIGRKIVGIIRK